MPTPLPLRTTIHRSRLLRGFGAILCVAEIIAAARGQATATLSTEDFLNRLGVNTHCNGLTPSDPWNTNATEIGAQLRYLGVRLVRDWPGSAADGAKWKAIQTAWSPQGRFWTSINEGGPQTQRASLAATQAIWSAYPNLIYAVGGPNEEDDDYARGQGATLPDAATVQKSLYDWAHADGRNLPVSQMEFGAGWTPTNNWQGDYNPARTGIGQPYTPGPADYAAAHTYLSNGNQIPSGILAQIRTLALLTTPGKPVAHTEVGAYQGAKLTIEQYGEFLVAGAFDSALHGDIAYLVYGLQDSVPEGTFGFFTYPDSKPNPAALYFHTLTTLLASDRRAYGPGEKATFAPKPLSIALSDPTIDHLTLQKPTGEFVLALWSERRSPETSPLTEHIDFGKRFSSVQVFDIERGATPLAIQHEVSQYTLPMTQNHTYLIVLADGKPR